MIKIQNIYYMLAYAYQSLSIQSAKQMSEDKFESALDLFANIISKGIAKQIKSGLCRDYVDEVEELNFPKGKILLANTIRQQVRQKKTVICKVDNYVENTYLNQILKTTVLLLMRSSEVDQENKRALKKVLLYFSNVEEVDPLNIKWNTLAYNRNNASYRMLINLCYLIVNGMIISDVKGNIKLNHFVDDQRMSALYEKFIFMYYKKHFPQYKVSRPQIAWESDDNVVDLLPKMQSDIVIDDGEKILIIDAKYYGESLRTNSLYGNKTIHSNNLYQIYAYVKNKDKAATGNVSGLLLYANTDGENPNISYSLGGNRISVQTLDLDCDFTEIKKQLDHIVLDWQSK